MSNNNPWNSAVAQVTAIREYLKMTDDEFARLTTHDQVVERSLTLKMDDGSTKIFNAFRAQHNNALGPYKGGLRFHPLVTRDEVKALSMWMTWKTSVVGLPLGGGKGGIIVDPKALSGQELERLSKLFMRRFSDILGPQRDVPAPDVNTDGNVMNWMVEECRLVKGKAVCEATFTGKPVNNGGSQGRIQATGRGGFYVLEELAKKKNLSKEKTTIAIQGLGNVGYWFAKLAADAGYKIVAVSDSRGAITSLDSSKKFNSGIDIDEVIAYKEKHGSLAGNKNYQTISNEEILELDVDVLVPAALDGVIHEENVEAVKADYIIEMANGPITADADQVLKQRHITVIPDILANAGGVTVSYFEWQQNLISEKWSEEKVNKKLKKVIVEAFEDIWSEKETVTRKKSPISLRQAAYILAVKRVLKAMKNRDTLA